MSDDNNKQPSKPATTESKDWMTSAKEAVSKLVEVKEVSCDASLPPIPKGLETLLPTLDRRGLPCAER